MSNGPNRHMRLRMNFILGCFFLGICVLVGSLFNTQILKHDYYEQKAVSQQTKDTLIAPQRGAIYDRNMTTLAESATIDTIAIDPSQLRREKDKLSAEELSAFLAETLGLDYDSVFKKTQKNTSYEYIMKKVTKLSADEIRLYASEKKSKAIIFEEDSKRYYPYGNFAAHILGFVGSDNQGLSGVESAFDNELKGTAGRIIGAKKGDTEMPFEYEQYVEAQDGHNLVLTIDEVIQHFLEKYLDQARVEYGLRKKATGIVVNVNTGEILALAVKEDFDPNSPGTITNEAVLLDLEKQKAEGNENAKSEYLQSTVWRNNAISDTYEPGSVFKMFTAAMALEEGSATMNSTYFCAGSVKIGKYDIGCWKRTGHGQQTFSQALENSCNPALMQMVAGVGRDAFYKYQEAFGFREKTGIDITGEGTSILHPYSNLKEVQLATSAFGQTFKVTPIQMIMAISAIANGGTLYKPQLVKEFRNSDGMVVESFAPTVKRQVISKETSQLMCQVLRDVVSKGTAKNANIVGFQIAGKTGTSEKRDEFDAEGNADRTKRIASFGGFAPANNPQIALLVILDEPANPSMGGGQIAAPTFRNIMADTLNYLGIEPQYSENEMGAIEVVVPTFNETIIENARTSLKKVGLEPQIIGDGDTVIDQIPKANSKIPYGSKVYLFTQEGVGERNTTVPDLTGMTIAKANQVLAKNNLNIKITGATTADAKVKNQKPAAGVQAQIATIVTVELQSNTDLGE